MVDKYMVSMVMEADGKRRGVLKPWNGILVRHPPHSNHAMHKEIAAT